MPLRRSVTAGMFLALSVGAASGCVTGGAAPLDEDFFGDPICPDTAADSPTDMACHEDCERPCGFNGTPNYERAIKYCVCQSGVYIECRCPRPDWYVGSPDAPYCDKLTDDGSGRTQLLQGRPCDNEWDQCIARDPVDGFTPRGCVCLNRDARTPPTYEWSCGSTEKWFYPEQ